MSTTVHQTSAPYGMRLNQSPPSARNPLLICAVALMALSLIVVDFAGLSELGETFGRGFIIVFFGAALVSIWRLIVGISFRVQQARALRMRPSLAGFLEHATATFDPEVRSVELGIPELSTNPLHYFRNQNLVVGHMAYLAELQTPLAAQFGKATVRFRTDNLHYQGQQLTLSRLAFQASAILHQVEKAHPKLANELQSVPEAVALPRFNDGVLLSAEAYQRKWQMLNSGTANVLSRSLVEAGRGNLGMAVVATTAAVAINVVQYQKRVREMHNAHAQVERYVADAGNHLKELGRSHRNIVESSQQAHGRSRDILALLIWFDENPKQWKDRVNAIASDVLTEKTITLARLTGGAREQATRPT